MLEDDRQLILKEEMNNSFENDFNTKDIVESIVEIIEDGTTLNMNEYRVLSFCLSHANESNKSRLIDGTHTYLATIMGVSRPRITRLYSVARKKIVSIAREKDIAF